MNQLNNLATTTMVELNLLCLIILVGTTILGIRYYKLMERKTNWLILMIQLCYGIALVSDSYWVVGEYVQRIGKVEFYFTNTTYFIALTAASYLWLLSVCEQLELKLAGRGLWYTLMAFPAAAIAFFAATTNTHHLLFYIDEHMKYERGPGFVLFFAVCYGYIAAAGVISGIIALRSDGMRKQRAWMMVGYALPILLTGVMQFVTGLSVVCVGYTVSLLLHFAYDVIFIGQMEHARLLASTEVLKQAKQDAECASEAKSAFLYGMSHDIRTPLNAIISYSEMIGKNKYQPDEITHYLEQIRQSGNYLVHMIDRVLQMAELESGTAVLDEEPCDMYEFINGLLTVMQAEAKERDIAYFCDVNLAHPYIYCDRAKLEQVVLNLCGNAIKYTTAGGTVRVTVQEQPADVIGSCHYRMVVEDNGIGIPKEFLSQIYDEFAKNDTGVRRTHGGSGLGLSITKRIIDMMHGEIEIESEPGQGTRVTVHGDFRIAERPTLIDRIQISNYTADFKGKRVLVAEDNRVSRTLAEDLLKRAGFEVDCVEDGLRCVDALQKMNPGYYDLILMDIMMPIMDGHQATQRIRQLPDRRLADIPIVATSANVFENDKLRAFESGMNGFVTKPLDIDKLYYEIHRALIKK